MTALEAGFEEFLRERGVVRAAGRRQGPYQGGEWGQRLLEAP